MIQYLFLLMIGSEVNSSIAHQDSVFIYNTYKENIDVLKNTIDPEEWYAYEDSITRMAACSFFRLSKFNKHTYRPIEEFNKEGMGVAYAYPQPSNEEEIDFETIPEQNIIAQVNSPSPAIKKVSSPVIKPVSVQEIKTKPAAVPVVNVPPPVGPVAFTVLDHQTHFLVSNNGKTKTPYIEMYYYAKGRVLVKTEKINPITLKPLEVPQPEVKQTALIVSTE